MFNPTLTFRLVPIVSKRTFSTGLKKQADFTHAVIGGGAVGLAIARQIAARDGTSTLLIERNGRVGEETSSRNSEVIHAGLYYGPDTLKTRLCIRGRRQLYALCKRYAIPHNNCGKWVVAQTNQQWEELCKVHKFSQSIEDVPTYFLPIEEGAKLEPSVQAKTGILVSPTTGIVDSHAYMQFLLGDFEDRGGDLALNSAVTRVTPLGDKGSSGWEITTIDRTTNEETTFTSETIINSAGLGACDVHNMIVPESRRIKPYYAKGNYFSYSASTPKTSRLIYPAPVPGHGGLGTHLTLDIAGRIRFGPDVEWVDNPNDLSVTTSRLKEAVEQIKLYFPDVQEDCIHPDYAGIRPKLKGESSAVAGGKGFLDFVVRKEEGFEGWVNLLGIESPGLTSSLALGEEVERILYGSAGDAVDL